MVGRDRSHLSDFRVAGDLRGAFIELGDDRGDGCIDTALQVHGIHPGGIGPAPLAHDRLSEHNSRGGAVTGEIAGLGCNLAQHLGAHVLKPVAELDLLGDGHAILRRARGAKGLFNQHVAALRAQGGLHRLGKHIDASEHLCPRIVREQDLFRCHATSPAYARRQSLRQNQAKPAWPLPALIKVNRSRKNIVGGTAGRFERLEHGHACAGLSAPRTARSAGWRDRLPGPTWLMDLAVIHIKEWCARRPQHQN